MIGLLARRAGLDYARRPLNLILLVVVPVVLVVMWGGTLAEFSELLGGTGDRVQIEAATAGWAAAALAGLAGFFQVTGSRAADRRLAAAGRRTAPVVAGRLGAAFGLALLASAGGLLALAARNGINDPPRVVAATVLFAIIYLALGTLVGTFVGTRSGSEMNGALLVTLAWVLDVFFGAVLGESSSTLTRVLPLHFPSLVLTDQASGHAGALGDLGWSLAWAVGLSTFAVARMAVITRPALTPVTIDPTRTVTRLSTWLRAGMREYRRNRVLWVLLVIVPAIFIALSVAVTPESPGSVALVEGARHFDGVLSERRMHAMTMVPITVAFLSGLTGLFVVTGSAKGDHRLVLAGFRPWEVLAGHLGVIAVATTVTTAVAVSVSGAWFPPKQWAVFVMATLLVAFSYAMVGVVVGPLTGRLGGLYLVLLLAFLDQGLGQSIMLPSGPPVWGAFVPGRGTSRVLIDAAFTDRFDEVGFLLLALAWLVVLTAMATAVFHGWAGSKRS